MNSSGNSENSNNSNLNQNFNNSNFNSSNINNQNQMNNQYQQNVNSNYTQSNNYNTSNNIYSNDNYNQTNNNLGYINNPTNNTNQMYNNQVNSNSVYTNNQNINQGMTNTYYSNGYNQSNNNQIPYNNYGQSQYNSIGYNNYSNNGYGNYQYNQNNVIKKKRSLKTVFVVACVVIIGLFLIFSGKNITKNRDVDYERTIMIYMVGADLESGNLGLATFDLDGIDYNKLNEQNTKVVLIAGGSTSWHNNYINSNETSIYELTENGYEVVKKQDMKNMGEAVVLSDFLNYSYENYKSKKYDLVFWNHGLGVFGSESDEIYDDYLFLSEISSALKNSPFSRDNKMELVLFRTCLNGTIEVADTLKDYSNYMIASQEITNGFYGNSFLKVLNNITKNDDGKKIGTMIVDGYMDYIDYSVQMYGSSFSDIYSTYSVIDLSKLDKLETSINEFFSSINVSTNYNEISRVRANLLQYGSADPSYDSVDLYNLVYNLKDLSPTKAQNVFDAFQQVIVYNVSTDERSKGLSVYFPYKGETEFKSNVLSIVYNFNDLSEYKSFISSFNSLQSSSSYKTAFTTNNISIDRNNTESDFSLELTDEQKENYSRAIYLVFRDNKDGTYLPVYNSSSVTLDGNALKANIKDRQLKVIDSRDNSENIITLSEIDETDEYIKYKTHVTLEQLEATDIKDFNFQAAEMNLILNKRDNTIQLGSISATNSSKDEEKQETKQEFAVSLPKVSIVNLKDYSHVAFVSSSYKILDSNGNYNNNWESDGVIKGLEVKVDNMEFKLQDYNDGYDYYAVFKIWDVNNNSYYSKLIKMN